MAKVKAQGVDRLSTVALSPRSDAVPEPQSEWYAHLTDDATLEKVAFHLEQWLTPIARKVFRDRPVTDWASPFARDLARDVLVAVQREFAWDAADVDHGVINPDGDQFEQWGV